MPRIDGTSCGLVTCAAALLAGLAGCSGHSRDVAGTYNGTLRVDALVVQGSSSAGATCPVQVALTEEGDSSLRGTIHRDVCSSAIIGPQAAESSIVGSIAPDGTIALTASPPVLDGQDLSLSSGGCIGVTSEVYTGLWQARRIDARFQYDLFCAGLNSLHYQVTYTLSVSR
jgi:hypothetical protein